MAKLFVSYSRKDSVAARKLIEAFKSMGQEVWVDWEAIPPAVDWLEQIFRGIEEADAFIFMISPDSIASEVCKVEIGRALQNNKRIIPIVLRDVNPKDTLEDIRKLNWTFIRETDNLEEGLAKVKTAIELDLDWLEEHRRLQVRALEWHRRKDPSLLLRGRDLRNARHMMQTYTSKDPIPTELQTKYIEFSERTERTRNIVVILTAITLVILIALTFVAVDQSNAAQAQRNVAQSKATEANSNRILAEQNAMTSQANANVASTQRAIANENAVKAENAQKLAEAQRSAARAQIYQSRPGELYTSTLLAIDSMERAQSAEAEEIIRRNISLLPLPVAQVSQGGKINALAFNQDGSKFVTASADGTACVWNVKDGTKLFCTPSGQPSINAAAFSPDGSIIMMGDQSGLIQILDTVTGDVQHVYQRSRSKSGSLQFVDVRNGGAQNAQNPAIPVLSLQFRPPISRQIAVAYEDGEIPVFDPKTGSISSPLSTVSKPNAFGFSPNGNLLAAGNEDGRVSVWNLSSNQIMTPTSHRKGVLAMAFGGGNKLATSGNDNSVAMISLASGKELFRLSTQSPVRDLAFSPDGTWLVTVADDHRIRIWDTEDGQELLGMSQDGAVTRVAISPDGKWIATTGDDKTTRVWDAVTGTEIFQIPLSASGAELSFSNDGRYLVSTDQNGAINIWDMSQLAARLEAIPFKGALNSAQYSPSGEQLAVSGKNGIWLLSPNAESGLISRPQDTPTLPFKSIVDNLAFSPDSKYLGISTSGKEMAIYDNIARRFLTQNPVASLLKSIAFSLNNQQFIASDVSGNIQAMSLSNAQLIQDPGQEYPKASSLAASPKFLAFGSKDKISLMNANRDRGALTLDALGGNTMIALSQDGTWLASTDDTGKIQIWKYQNGNFTSMPSLLKEQASSMSFNPKRSLLAVAAAKNAYLIDPSSGTEIARISFRDPVTSVSFSADGKYLTTTSSNVLQLWELSKIQQIKSDQLIEAACSRLTKNFSQAQWQAFFGNDQAYKQLCDKLPVPQ